ncbi:hypothetical protein [Haladaptatus sp. NG-SE-30]
MSGLDWSTRYLGLAGLSTGGTVAMWFFDSALVIYVALVTAVAFAVLALFHARRLREAPQL